MAFAVPALALPLENVGLAARNATLPEDGDNEDCDEDEEDQEDEE